MKNKFKHLLALCFAVVLTLSACATAGTPMDTTPDTLGDTEAVTEAVTEADITTEAVTDATTEAGTEAVTDAEVATDATTDAVTEAPTETETEAVTQPEDPLAKYQLGYGSTLDMSAYNPIKNVETVVAPNDDPAMKLWFDHSTEKVDRYNTTSTGKTTYTIQMAKNEMEACQFFLYYPEQMKVTLKISDFTNDKGETLKTELGVEYYVEDGYVDMHAKGMPVYPDAVIPYASYITKTEGNYYEEGPWVSIGPYSPKIWDLANYPYKDTSRAFVVQATTTAKTTPGAYKATIEICDADTGKCIKMANVYTYVFDVTLSDETAMDTSFQIWANSITQQYHNLESPYSDGDILKAVADFLLEYRVTPSATYITDYGAEYLENPRMTTVRLTSKAHYDAYKDNSTLAPKMFFYGQDEPGTSRPNMNDSTGYASIEMLKTEATMLIEEWGWSDYRMVSPFEINRNYTREDSKDQIDFMSRYVNIWCPKFYSLTPRALSSISGSRFTHSIAQDKRSGELEDRLHNYVANDGDELWMYVSCVPTYSSPYQNILLYNDGTEARTMFWTCYDLEATGFLYWHVSNYSASTGTNTYTMRCPFNKEGYADGILIYPGAVYGQLEPIPSLRLIGVRDGIEDYQLLYMLEEAVGAEMTDTIVHHITTSTLTYTKDDEVVYNVHSYLLRELEKAQASN